MAYEFKLPSLGDGVTGKVMDILVKAGDAVKKDQNVLVVGTDKVDAEIPVDQDGTVTEVLVKKGDDVTDGSPVLRMETGEAASAPSAAPAAPATPAPQPTAPAAAPVAASAAAAADFKLSALVEGVSGNGTVVKILIKAGDVVKKDQIILEIGTDKVNIDVPMDRDGIVEAVLVSEGQEINENTVVLRFKSSAATSSAAPAATSAAPATPPPAAPVAVAKSAEPAATAAASTGQAPRVSPLARKRAKEFGVNLSDVRPGDGSNRISYKDVVDFVKRKVDTGGGSSSAGTGMAKKKLPDFAKHGSIERKPLSRIGVLTADNMHYAFNTIPHAWISEKADVTRLEQLRQANKDAVKNAGGSLTMTAIITKAVSGLLKKMPQFNTSLDDETNEVIYKSYVNIGIAVDTPRGLLVPVLRHCDQKSLTQISIDLSELSTRTRDGKNKADDLDGGTFTISNIGGIGGTNMISIVNWPQVAILSIVAAQMEPVWNEATKSFEPRLMMPMTIGWDHRVINGADAARFLVELKKVLEEPFMAWL
jgi:pyruvate dehydrogenase E2 component (dihydrolipoamide acetyltransferase)